MRTLGSREASSPLCSRNAIVWVSVMKHSMTYELLTVLLPKYAKAGRCGGEKRITAVTTN